MPKSLLYLHGLGCNGDTISLLNAEEPDLLSVLEFLDIEVLWHPTFSHKKDGELKEHIEDILSGKTLLDILAIEGAVPLRPEGTGIIFRFFDMPFVQLVRSLAEKANFTVAVGTCASFGGIPGIKGNPANACGLQFTKEKLGGVLGKRYRSRSGLPVINIPGCPIHPDWFVETLFMIASGELGEKDLDYANRPSLFYNSLAHHGCPKNEFYEFKSSATEFGQMGCLFEFLGCRGTQCESDCNIRLWLGRTGSCTRGWFPCIACTSQGFPSPGDRFFKTEMIGKIPKYLPKDVPKAWYIGIASLSKMAMPERLKVNSESPYPKYPVNRGD